MNRLASKFLARSIALALLGGYLSVTVVPTAYADPPPWAPAHGWRKKHDPYYVGYNGYKWPDDFGVLGGRCNRAAIGAVLGGAVGGAIGSTVGSGDGRAVAILVGTVLGAVVGSQIGKQMDEEDRACWGHTLELAKRGETVTWVNSANGLTYAVTPVRDYTAKGQPCREFKTRITADGKAKSANGKACRADDGTWQMV